MALWVQAQSGGRTRICLVGKPAGPCERFDLIIASSENQMPPLPGIQMISLPLMRVDEAAVARAAHERRADIGALPRPLTGFLIGGPTGLFRYDQRLADRLTALARDVVGQGGTPFLTTSRRTNRELIALLQAGLPAEARLFVWSPDAPDNPYRALLGLADRFVVTGDSVSMMTEVIRLRRPLAILPVPYSPLGRLDQIRRGLTRRLFAPGASGFRRRLADLAYRAGLLTQTRDFEAFHALLVQGGLAVRAGEPFRGPTGLAPDDLEVVRRRIEAFAASLPAHPDAA